MIKCEKTFGVLFDMVDHSQSCVYRGRDSLLFVPVPDVADDVPALRPFEIDGKEEEEVVVVQGTFGGIFHTVSCSTQMHHFRCLRR